jgi:hypothetical protein
LTTTRPATPSTHTTKMRLYYPVSGILLVLPIINFALAAPVVVQEKRQAGVDVVHILEDAVPMLGKRGDDLDELFLLYEDHFAQPEESSAARPSSSSPPSVSDPVWTDLKQPLPSVPEGWSPVSSPDHAPPNPGPSTESDHELAGMHAPLSSPVLSTWFHPDHELMGAHAPQPNLGPSNPTPSTEFDSDHRLVAEEPLSRPASPTEFDADNEYQVVHLPPPSSPVSLKNPDRRSMGVGSLLKNL